MRWEYQQIHQTNCDGTNEAMHNLPVPEGDGQHQEAVAYPSPTETQTQVVLANGYWKEIGHLVRTG